MNPGESVVSGGGYFPRGMEIFQDQIMYIHMYSFMCIAHACAIDKYLCV